MNRLIRTCSVGFAALLLASFTIPIARAEEPSIGEMYGELKRWEAELDRIIAELEAGRNNQDLILDVTPPDLSEPPPSEPAERDPNEELEGGDTLPKPGDWKIRPLEEDPYKFVPVQL